MIWPKATVGLALAMSFFLAPGTALGQSAPTVTDRGVENRFPDGMTFRMEAMSNSPIVEIRLRYEIQPDGTAANGVPEFEANESVTASFELTQVDDPLPPGTTVEYYWEVTNADGDTTETEPESFYYDDVRFEWTLLGRDGVIIHYYSGGEDAAQSMHDLAVETLDEVAGLLGTEIPFEVHVWIYASPDDMRPALQKLSSTRDQGVITAGVRVASNTVLVLGEGSFDTLRHELTHVVTAEAGEGIVSGLPFWLDEGTAVYFQNDKGWFQDAIERALDRGNVFSIHQITTIAGDPDDVGLYYGQGWHIVNYLVDTYGENRFAELFAEMKSGTRVDNALEAVYGFDSDGLEDEWRDANGLPARVTADPEPPGDDPASVTTPDGGGTSTGVMVALAAAVLALAAAVGLAGITLARRMS